jgi:hypothetical protein
LEYFIKNSPWAVGQYVYDIKITPGVYISIFKIDLAGKERLIELRYEMDITSFKMLFRLQIDSSYMDIHSI